jgi:hypothetical protein
MEESTYFLNSYRRRAELDQVIINIPIRHFISFRCFIDKLKNKQASILTCIYLFYINYSLNDPTVCLLMLSRLHHHYINGQGKNLTQPTDKMKMKLIFVCFVFFYYITEPTDTLLLTK